VPDEHPVTVRPARPEDESAVDTLHEAAVRELGADAYDERQVEAWIYSPDDDADDPPPTADPARRYVVAERDGRVVGFGDLRYDEAEVYGCYVHPDHARTGVGTALLRDLEAAARERDLDELTLHASLNAVAFYERQGYDRVDETTVDSTAPDGGTVPLPVVAMEKRLDRG